MPCRGVPRKVGTHTHTVGDLCADSLPCLLPQVTIGASDEASERGDKRAEEGWTGTEQIESS